MLQFILKEQIKIRLSEVIMSHSSFTLDIVEKSSEQIQPANIDFNESDFIEWLADSLKTELDEQFSKKFFLEGKSKPICKISPINKALVHQKKFLKEYNTLFHGLQDGSTVEDIVNSSGDKNHTLLMLYFGLLTKSLFLRDVEEEKVNLKKTEQLLDFILEQDSKNLFAVLNLPWEASPEEVQIKYQQLVLRIHPQVLPSHAEHQLKEKCEKAFSKINKSYTILNHKDKRKEYLRIRKEEDFIEVMNKYEEGLTKIKQEQYQKGITILEQITDHMHAPSNTNLYILLAQLKTNDEKFSKPQNLAKIKIAIDSCSISLRTSALWWYVKGLYYVKTGQYEPAEELFRKSLKIERDFVLAKRDLLWLKQKVKNLTSKKTNKLLDFFLKKSG